MNSLLTLIIIPIYFLLIGCLAERADSICKLLYTGAGPGTVKGNLNKNLFWRVGKGDTWRKNMFLINAWQFHIVIE